MVTDKPITVPEAWLVTYEPTADQDQGRFEFEDEDEAYAFYMSKGYSAKLWHRPEYQVPRFRLVSRKA